MAWFRSKAKPAIRYVSDPADWRFELLYKHHIDLAIGRLGHQQKYLMDQGRTAARPMGEWEAKGIVHFGYAGPYFPFRMIVGDKLPDGGGLGHFSVEQIEPYSYAGHPEKDKQGFLALRVYLADAAGELRAALEEAMLKAAVSRKQFLRVRLLKAEGTGGAMADQIRQRKYTDNYPIAEFILPHEVEASAPAWSLDWDEH